MGMAAPAAEVPPEVGLRIAFIAFDINYQGGPAKVTAALIERFCEDHQVSVFSHTIEGIDLSKIKYYKVPALTRPKFLACITFPASSTIILAILFLFRKWDFDIIYSTEYFCGFYANVLASHFCEREGLRLEKANVIEIPHKSIWQKLKALDHKIYRSLMAFAEGPAFGRNSSKARIVVSQRMKGEFIRHYGNAAENLIVIPNGVDLKIFTPANQPLYRDRIRQKHGISHNDLVLMFAGGDWERKGVPYIIEALSLLPRLDVKLFTCGSGDEIFYSQLAELKQVRERIIFVSHSSRLWEYYAASDVFVFPTIYEPFGLVIVEAMASGLPVITSRVAGAADFMKDGVDCLLLNNPSNVNELATKIELLLSNAELRKTMAERARMTAEKLSWDAVAEKTLEVYNSILNRSVFERLRVNVTERLQKNSRGSG